MSWLVDNAKPLYVLLGVIAAGLVAAWWLNKRAKFLGYATCVIALIGLVWLMTQFGTSDAKQLEANVNAMADAVVAGKVDDLFKHISKDFIYKGMNREMLYEAAQRAVRADRITSVQIKSFHIDDLDREKKLAKTRFRVIAAADREIMFVTQADFVLEGDQWKLQTMRFYNPIVEQDQEMDLPGLR